MWTKTRFSKGPLLAACAVLLLGGLAAAAFVGIGRFASGSSALGTDPAHLEVHKSADSQMCERASIHLTVRGEGDPVEEHVPVDVMLVLDRSGSMSQGSALPPIHYAKQAAKALVDELDPNVDQVGLVSYADWASLDHQLTSGVSGFNAVKSTIDGLSANGYTNIGDAVYKAQQELESPRHNPDAIPVIVLLTDGIANRSHADGWCTIWPSSPTVCTNDAINQAATAKANGTIIFTVGLNLVWDDQPAGVGTLAREVLRTMATQPWTDYYFETTDPADLEDIFETIAGIITHDTAGDDVQVIEILPDNLHYVVGSAEVDGTPREPDSISFQTLTWDLGSMSIGDVHTIDFEVTVDTPGTNLLMDEYPDSRVEYDDYQDNPQSVPFPETRQTVLPCGTDLAIEKTDDPDPVVAGSNLVYTLVVTNNGSWDAINVVVVDDLPAGVSYVSDTDSCVESPVGRLTCPLGDIGAGGSESFDVTVAVDLGTSGVITGGACVSSDTADLNPANDCDKEDTTVSGLCGDVDCNESLQMLDAMMIAQYVMGLRCGGDVCDDPGPDQCVYLPAADVDCNGLVQMLDAMLVSQCVMGLIDCDCDWCWPCD